MSLYPILWAAEHAPVRDAEERAILTALVIKGDPDGCNCCCSYKTLAQVARVDQKTAGRKCRAMESRGLLRRQTAHLSKAWEAIPAEQRPVVWEAMIPAEWWDEKQLAGLNEQRAALGRPAITAATRPTLAEAPPKKPRADKAEQHATRNGVSARRRERVFTRDGYRCLACGATADLTIDHIRHQSRGGAHDEDNLRTLCRSCNSRRRAGHLPGIDAVEVTR